MKIDALAAIAFIVGCALVGWSISCFMFHHLDGGEEAKKEVLVDNGPYEAPKWSWSPMAVCPECGNVGIGEEFIGAKCSCGATTVRYGTTDPSPDPPAPEYKDAVL